MKNKQNLFMWFELPGGVKQHLRANAGEGLVNPDGDLHITAFYEKDVEARAVQQLMAQIRLMVQGWEPIRVSTTGAAIFDGAGDGGRFPLIYLINAPGLERWRVQLMDAFKQACGRECSQRFGYIPHITLTYVEPGQELAPGWEVEMVRMAPPAWMMRKIGIKWGDKAYMLEIGAPGWRELHPGEGA